MAGVQLLTAQGQAPETGQHLPEEARFREALVERQPHGPHADLEQLQADRAALRPRQPRARQAPATSPRSAGWPSGARLRFKRGFCAIPSTYSTPCASHQASNSSRQTPLSPRSQISTPVQRALARRQSLPARGNPGNRSSADRTAPSAAPAPAAAVLHHLSRAPHLQIDRRLAAFAGPQIPVVMWYTL